MATIFEEEFGEPVHPLDEVDVCHLIKAGKLRLPTSAELEDKCKSDGLAKFLVLVQVRARGHYTRLHSTHRGNVYCMVG